MDFLDKLNFLMERDKYNKSSLSKASGIPYTTIDGWYKRGYDELRLPTVKKLCSFFNTSLDFWLKEDVTDPDYGKANGFEISFDEMEHIKKYRLISEKDTDGKILVDSTIDYLCKKIQEKHSLLKEIQNQKIIRTIENTATPTRIINYYHRLASAGSGEYLFDSIPTDNMVVPLNEISKQADFVIGVNGRSMEPTYSDGDKVYVKITDEIPIGCIGLFTRGNDCFIKELGVNCLISHNHADGYENIPASEDIKLVGEVLGKIEDD